MIQQVIWYCTFRRKKGTKTLTEKLNYTADHDELTGIFNRGKLNKLLHKQYRLLRTSRGSQYCICFADIDFFKKINDSYGHNIGDEVLQDVCNIMRDNAPTNMQIGRGGGEEFALLFVDTTLDESLRTLEKIQYQLSTTLLSSANVRVSLSFSVVQAKSSEALDHTLKRADVLLYKAKQAGRNQIVS
ncbi:MAG: GGDEF domain-containing protein [Glaciecola sp.]